MLLAGRRYPGFPFGFWVCKLGLGVDVGYSNTTGAGSLSGRQICLLTEICDFFSSRLGELYP